MTDQRTAEYAAQLSEMIRVETVSVKGGSDRTRFYALHQRMHELFPRLFAACEVEDFDGSLLLRWQGRGEGAPILLMNHHDVVEASGDWRYPPFSGTVAEGRVWGRGTLDTKGGLWAMLRAAEELIGQGFVPRQDVYFLSSCTEETDGSGADAISRELQRRGIRLGMVLDEGGMILPEPIGGARGTFAMIGLGEKGCADLKFIARSSGGHASTPGRNTPLVRLGKFMAAVERSHIFRTDLSPTVARMFRTLSETMKGPMRTVLGHPRLFKPLLVRVIPAVSDTAAAMLRTTVAFTQARGSEGTNVLPEQAYVIGNMRYSHHQGREDSIAAITALAAKYDLETEVLDSGFPSAVTDVESEAYKLVARAVRAVFPDVIPSPYLMTGASDSRFLGRVCDRCIRFAPFRISHEQMASVHGIDESVDLSTLTGAVDFYKYILTEARL